jgi:hypothetical protein
MQCPPIRHANRASIKADFRLWLNDDEPKGLELLEASGRSFLLQESWRISCRDEFWGAVRTAKVRLQGAASGQVLIFLVHPNRIFISAS